MIQRSFQRQFTRNAQAAFLILLLLTGYFFWVKLILPAALLLVVEVLASERLLHTRYVLTEDCLSICKGRFAHTVRIPFTQISDCRTVRNLCGLVQCTVVECTDGRCIALQPERPEEFARELRRRCSHTAR